VSVATLRLGPDGALRCPGAGGPVPLTRAQRAILAALAERPGAVRSHDDLLAAIRGPGGSGERGRVIAVHVLNLRRRLSASGHDDVIATVHGEGFRLNAERYALEPALAAPLVLSLPPADLARLESYAAQTGVSLSGAVAELLSDALDALDADACPGW